MKKTLRTWLLNVLLITEAIAKPCPPMEGNYAVSQKDEANTSYYSNIFADAEHTRSWLEKFKADYLRDSLV